MKTLPMSEYIRKRVASSQKFRDALIDEALDAMLAGDKEGALRLLEDVARARESQRGMAKLRRPRRREAAQELVEA